MASNSLNTSYSLTTIIVSYFKIECEQCNHIFAFGRGEGVQAGTMYDRTKTDAEKFEHMKQGVEKDLTTKVEKYTKAVLCLDFLVTPVVKCPQCKYVQSWMINSAKEERAKILALIPTVPLLLVGIYLVRDWSFLAFMFADLVMVVIGLGLWFVLKRLLYNNIKYNPNKGQKAAVTRLPSVKMKFVKPGGQHKNLNENFGSGSEGFYNKKGFPITLEDFEDESFGAVINLTVDNS